MSGHPLTCSEDTVSRDRTETDDPSVRPLPPRLDPRAGRPPRASATANKPTGGEPANRPGRSRSAVAVRSVAALMAVAVLATTGWGWYLGRVAEASVQRTDAIPTSGNDGTAPGEAMNLLLVGTDSRDDLTAAQLAELNAG